MYLQSSEGIRMTVKVIHGLGKVFALFLGVLLFLSSCGTGIPIKIPKFPQGNEGTRLKAALDGKKRVAVVAKELSPYITRSLNASLATEWSDTIRAKMKSALEEYGYYTMVDVDSRNARYNELAQSQTGLSTTQLAIGQELQSDHLFFVNMTAIPRTECKIEMVTDALAVGKMALQLALANNKNSKSTNVDTPSQPTGVLYLTVFVEGKLVNIETGRSVSYMNTEPFRLENSAGNQQCPSELMAFDQALKQSTEAIAKKLSPKVNTVRIPLEDSVANLKGGDKNLVTEYLKDGINWVEAGDLEEAGKSWEMANEESGGTSSSALWNLAVLKFATGDMNEADQLFQRALTAGGPSFLSTSKRGIYALFKVEKKRIEEEGN